MHNVFKAPSTLQQFAAYKAANHIPWYWSDMDNLHLAPKYIPAPRCRQKMDFIPCRSW